MKSDLNVGCIPIEVGACWMREVWLLISFGLFDERPRRPPAGGAGGKKPCDGFNGVICGWSVDGKGWCWDWDWLDKAETWVGRLKLAVDVVSFPV